MPGQGHVFVIRGDITSLICDWWLLPSGTKAGKRGDVSHHWLEQDPDLNRFAPEGRLLCPPSGSDRAVMVRPRAEDRPGVIAVHTGDRGDEYPDWFAEAIRAAVLVAQRQPRTDETHTAPLRIAAPLVGTGAGGAGPRRAGVVEALMEQAREATTAGVDIIFVVLDAQAFSAMQRYRAESPTSWWPFEESSQHWKAAERLADHARAGTLVPFIGAGVSQAAGLDSWTALLDALGEQVGLTADGQREALHRLDARDAGRLLDLRFRAPPRKSDLSTAIRNRYANRSSPALTHALLASLPISEAVTTNYDRLFETAWENAVGDPRSRSTSRAVKVLPKDTGPAPRWLLKIHGDIDDTERALVLSRDEYARLEQSGGALTGVLQALLMTRHLLIVGYGLTDETFQRVAHDIRGIRQQSVAPDLTAENDATRVGTTLLIRGETLGDELWKDDLHMHSMWQDGDVGGEPERRLEILLDLVAHLAAPSESYLLGDGLLELSQQDPDASVRRHLEALNELSKDERLPEPLRRALIETVRRFGGSPAT